MKARCALSFTKVPMFRLFFGLRIGCKYALYLIEEHQAKVTLANFLVQNGRGVRLDESYELIPFEVKNK